MPRTKPRQLRTIQVAEPVGARLEELKLEMEDDRQRQVTFTEVIETLLAKAGLS